jgi:hypothetical protein
MGYLRYTVPIALSYTGFADARNIVFEGDSITAAGGWSTPSSRAALPGYHTKGSRAVPGGTLNDMIARAAGTDALLVSGALNVLSVLIAANELSNTTTYPTVNNWLTALAGYCDARRAAGWKIVLATPLPISGNTEHNLRRATASPEIRLWTASGSIVSGKHADVINDFAADPIMGVDNSKTLYPTLWDDTVHPSSLGYQRLGYVATPAIGAGSTLSLSGMPPTAVTRLVYLTPRREVGAAYTTILATAPNCVWTLQAGTDAGFALSWETLTHPASTIGSYVANLRGVDVFGNVYTATLTLSVTAIDGQANIAPNGNFDSYVMSDLASPTDGTVSYGIEEFSGAPAFALRSNAGGGYPQYPLGTVVGPVAGATYEYTAIAWNNGVGTSPLAVVGGDLFMYMAAPTTTPARMQGTFTQTAATNYSILFSIYNATTTIGEKAWIDELEIRRVLGPTLTVPVFTVTGDTTATVSATTNTAGGTMYAVVTTSIVRPTKAQIKAGQNASGTAAVWAGPRSVIGTGVVNFSATGLSAGTKYHAHVVHETGAGFSNTLWATGTTTGVAASTSHNGGRSQNNFTFIYARRGDYPFINAMKLSEQPTFADGAAVPVTPDLLDADGYPLAIVHGGFHWNPNIAPGVVRPGNWIMTWDGSGTVLAGAGGSQLGTVTFTGSITGNTLTISGLSGTIQPGQRVVGGTVLPYTFIMSGSGTTYTVSKSQTATGITGANGGASTSSGGVGAGFFACTTNGTSEQMEFTINSIGSPRITNVQLFHVDDAALQASGEIFGTEFLRRVREANFGVLRFMVWHDNNTSNMTTWRTRKPASYMTYLGHQLNNSFYAGTASHTGNVYVSSQFPAIHSSDGTAWTSGGPKDKDTVHVAYTNSATTSGACSLSIGTSGVAINLLNQHGGPVSESTVFYPVGNSKHSLATLIYDADLAGWIQCGGNPTFGSVGISSYVPFEVCMELCQKVGAHPFFNAPYLSVDRATDFMAELAKYCKDYTAANATWMIPRFEGPNETWNSTFYQTSYGGRKSLAHWGAGDSLDAYGKWIANVGQMCAGVYGLGNLGITYHLLCGIQTSSGYGASEEKLAANKYKTQSAAADPAITGSFGTISFVKQSPETTTSHITTAQYYSGNDRYGINEVIKGYAYSITHKGNATAQAADATSYCDSLLGPIKEYNLAYLRNKWTEIMTWAAPHGIHRMNGYEGGYSPDYLNPPAMDTGTGLGEADSWWSDVTGRNSVNPAIIQLPSVCNSVEQPNSSIVGHPAVVGMAVTFFNTGTQFDNPGMYTRPVTFAGGTNTPSATITGTNTLRVNQAVFFRIGSGNTIPGGMTQSLQMCSVPRDYYSETYYVVGTPTATTCQVSATRGGTPITFTTSGSTQVYMQEAWFITSVDSANNRVTLDLDSTGFTAPTTGRMLYSKSSIYSNNIRYAGKTSPSATTHLLTCWNDFVNAGGEFPSNFLMSGDGPPVGLPGTVSGNAWNVLEPLNQSPNPPLWQGIITFNH